MLKNESETTPTPNVSGYRVPPSNITVTAADGEARGVALAGTSRGSTRISADRATRASAPICGRRAVVPARSAGVDGRSGHAQAGGERRAGLCVSRSPVHDTPACSRRARPLEIRADPRLVFFVQEARPSRRRGERCDFGASDPVESNAGAVATGRRWVPSHPFGRRLSPADHTRFPASARRTVRADFQHTALGLVSRPDMRPASTWRRRQVEEALLLEEPFRGEALRPSPREFVPASQKAACAMEQELIQPPIRPRHRSVGEVTLPATHDAVDLAHHVPPRSLIARVQYRAHAFAQASRGLSRRLRREIGPTRRPMHRGAEGVPRKSNGVCVASQRRVLFSFSVSFSARIHRCVTASASAAVPRHRMTKSSA